jgi:5-methylcytosine-specific restriction endonuclease McrA
MPSLPQASLPADAPVINTTELRERWEREFDERAGLRAEEKERKQREWFREHDLYLLTPLWRLKRKAVLDRCHYVCEGCGTQSAVEVHHLTYTHWKREFLFELVGLCAECHKRVHEG